MMQWKRAGIGLLALGGILGGTLATSGAAQAADGCGPGWFRNSWGDCRPGGYRPYYGPPRPIGFGPRHYGPRFGWGGGWGGHGWHRHHHGGWGHHHHHGGWGHHGHRHW